MGSLAGCAVLALADALPPSEWLAAVRREAALELWVAGVKEEAVGAGIRRAVVDAALAGVRPAESVVEKDASQPEARLSAQDYIASVVSEPRISRGVSAYEEARLLLERVEAEYGVPAPILAALWGIESSYGQNCGSWDLIEALVTLAYNNSQASCRPHAFPHRATYFRKELIYAMHIMEDMALTPQDWRLKGSWAGAMGQCQFMPSSYRAYAVDYDHDGTADIWSSQADVFASMANYLRKNGWQVGDPYGQRVEILGKIDRSLLGLRTKKPVREWETLHQVSPLCSTGEPVLPADALASLLTPDGPHGYAYLACDNFRAIMRYNPSTLYAISVGELARNLAVRVGKDGGS
eukprot:SM000090S24353  [mRNA]  locus=s90:487642:489848:- [translate_table: standard]